VSYLFSSSRSLRPPGLLLKPVRRALEKGRSPTRGRIPDRGPRAAARLRRPVPWQRAERAFAVGPALARGGTLAGSPARVGARQGAVPCSTTATRRQDRPRRRVSVPADATEPRSFSVDVHAAREGRPFTDIRDLPASRARCAEPAIPDWPESSPSRRTAVPPGKVDVDGGLVRWRDAVPGEISITLTVDHGVDGGMVTAKFRADPRRRSRRRAGGQRSRRLSPWAALYLVDAASSTWPARIENGGSSGRGYRR